MYIGNFELHIFYELRIMCPFYLPLRVLLDPAEEMANPVLLEIQDPMAHLDLPEPLALAE